MAKLTIIASIELPEGWRLEAIPGDPSGELFLRTPNGRYHSPEVSWLRWDDISQDPDGTVSLMTGYPDATVAERLDGLYTEYHTILERD